MVVCVGVKRRLLNYIFHRKANWIGHILRKSLVCDATEEHDRSERSRKKYDLRNKREYWKLKEEQKIEKVGNNSLLHECKKEIQVIFHKSMDLLTSSLLNNKIIPT